MNVKRMEVMLGDLNENFQRHVAVSKETFYFVLNRTESGSKLKFRIYSQGADAQLEILAVAPSGNAIKNIVKVDGEVVQERTGAVTIAPIELARGWHVLEIEGGEYDARARITGNVSGASVLAD